MKKIVFITLTLSGFVIAGFLLDLNPTKQRGCAFCKEEILEAQVFYKGPMALGLITHKPAVPGHVLIIPARHVERFEELSSEEVAALGEAIKRVHQIVRKQFGNKDYLLLQKNGRLAGQSVPHVHFHYLPASRFLPFKFFLSPWLKPIQKEEIRLLRDSLSEQI